MEEKEKKTNQIKKSILHKILIIIGVIIGVLLLGIIALYIYVAVGSKKLDLNYDTLKNEMANYDGIEYSAIPQDLIDAVVSAEQPNFFSKNSYDLKKILNPMPLFSDVGLHNKTIPMMILDQGSSKTNMNNRLSKYLYNMKLVYFSSHVFEKDYSKEEILRYYLSSQYLGGESYGIEEASKYYFGKSVSTLTLPESAMIAGLFQAPDRHNPYNYIEDAETRKNVVIKLMYRYGYITKGEHDNALNIKIESLLSNKQESVIYTVTYNHKQEESFGSDDFSKKFNFKITNGILTITDINNNNYKLESIPDIKYIELLSPTSIDNVHLFILTNSGKVYIGRHIYKLQNAIDFKDIFKELNINKKIIDIGYTKEYKIPAISTFLVLKTDNEEYLYTNTSYDKYVIINSKNMQRTIQLNDVHESYDFDKLHLDFEGVTYKNDEGHYNYVLNIKYDDKDINSAFFNDKENYRIWSYNMTGTFRIYKIDEVYILVSSVAKQCFCDEVMIFNTNGDVLKTFTIAHFDKDESLIKIRTSDTGQCMGPGAEEHIKEYNYKIDGTQLVEQ